MPIVKDAKLARPTCPGCNSKMRLIQGVKDPGKYYISCNSCKSLADAEERGGKWGYKPKDSRRQTQITCKYCGAKLIEILRNSKAFCVCPNSKRGDTEDIHQDMIIFSFEQGVIGECQDCSQGYKYHDTTKKGAKVVRCSSCDYFEYEEKKKKEKEEIEDAESFE